MASKSFIDLAGLQHYDEKLQERLAHPTHSYTTAASAAKNWYRIANASVSQTNIDVPIHAEFILTSYNSSYDAGYYERWFVKCMVFGRTAHIVVFGNTAAPFSQIRVLYENTLADLDANDRPAIDLYLNNVLSNGTTKIEIEEIYNSGWTFVADGQISASTVPTGFENVASAPRNNGVNNATYADYVSYLNRQISNITAAFTLADSYLYRSRTLNCTGTFTITIPNINSGYMWCVIKNKNTASGVITLHPSTTSVLIDGSNADITLQPMEYVCIHSAGANNYSIIADGRWKSQKADKATTIAGYGITDAKIANGVITLGSATITPLTSHQSLSNYVTLNGAQTISAVKTFTASPAISMAQPVAVMSISGATKKTNPSSTLYGNINFQDKTTAVNMSKRAGSVDCGINTSGQTEVSIRAFDWSKEDNTNAAISIYYPSAGTPYTAAPTPAASDNTTKIATTAWARSATGNFACNAATASKLGTSTIGATDRPIYLNVGTATAVNSALKTCYGGVESEAVSNTYFKIGTGSISGSYNHLKLRILVQHLTGANSCVWDVWLASGSTAGVYSSGHSILFDSTGYYGANLIAAYKSNSGGSLDFELYVKEASRYSNHRFTVIQECWRNSQKVGDIVTLTNQLTSTGTATITSGYTTMTTANATVSMNINGSATKATQDASGNVITTTYATKAELADITSVTTTQIDTLF